MYRPTYIEVNGNVLENNVKNIISNYNKYEYYFGVVKNNAYHHGIYSIKFLIEGGVNYLAVSSLEEAIAIRKYNTTIPILCLEPIVSDYIFDAINNNVTLTIGSLIEAEAISNLKLSDELKIHLKIDSGMNRFGFKTKSELDKAYKLLTSTKKVFIEGVYTHLATSGISDPNYNIQIDNFLKITKNINIKEIPIVHVDRSLTMVSHDKLDFVNGVRLGIVMYGYKQNIPEGNFITKLKRKYLQKKYNIENVHLTNNLDIDYALSFYSSVYEVRKVSAGEYTGYGALYKFNEDSYVATIPVGYADGVVLDYKYVYINNKPYEIVAECMDMIMVKVDSSVKPFDKVEIIGKNQNIKTVGARMHMGGHKFLTTFTNRVPIVYTYNGEKTEIKY